MDRVIGILAIGLAFGLTVFVHEFGHFIAARLSGMTVHEFSIGFGRPWLFGFRRGETLFSVRLWPFLHYVRIAGMESGERHPRGFYTKSRGAQAFVLVLGCLMNFLLGAAIFILIGAVIGQTISSTRTIEKVLAEGPAARAGLRPGDTLMGVNGVTGLALLDISEAIQEHPGKSMLLEVERGGNHLTIAVTPKPVTVREMIVLSEGGKGAVSYKYREADKDTGGKSSKRVRSAVGKNRAREQERPKPKSVSKRAPDKMKLVYREVGRIGVVFQVITARMGVWESVKAGFLGAFEMIRFLIKYLIGAFAGRMPLALEGPVGVVHALYQESQTGWSSFLSTAAALTIGIGFLNLLPIPPLDGSRLVITAIEAIRRRPMDKNRENLVHLVGLVLFLLLVVALTYNDILNLVRHVGR